MADPLADLDIRYHAAMPNWCKLNGLEIMMRWPAHQCGMAWGLSISGAMPPDQP